MDGKTLSPFHCNLTPNRKPAVRYHTHPKYLPFPARHVNVRGPMEDKYLVVDITKEGRQGNAMAVLEEVEFSRALFELYEGGVVRHACSSLIT